MPGPRTQAARLSQGSLTIRQVMEYYNFPRDARGRFYTGAGTRIAILEFYGGFHRSDLQRHFASLGLKLPQIRVHDVSARDGAGVPLTGSNAPLSRALLKQIIGDYRDGRLTLAALKKRYGEQKVWEQFIATLECTADISIAGSVAPGARIDVYFAPRCGFGLVHALQRAVKDGADVISLSWGRPEAGISKLYAKDIGSVLRRAREQGITVCCASGDRGSWEEQKLERASVHFPASSPDVLACGGTRLILRRGEIVGEVAWNQSWRGERRASGGGISGRFLRPPHQKRLAQPRLKGTWQLPSRGARRLVPDVSANADFRSGYRLILGGEPILGVESSVAAPLWAGLIALLTQALGKPLGFLPELLYRRDVAETFNDIVDGDNATTARGAVRAFKAGPGWDACTGLGSPDGTKLLDALRQAL